MDGVRLSFPLHAIHMNLAAKKFSLVLTGAALIFAGCSHQPTRPTPNQTMMGPQTGGANINPTDVATNASPSPDLQARSATDDFGPDGQLRGKLEAVYFDFDRFDIKASERTKLQAVAQYLKDHADQRVLLEGHCDWRGTAEYNLSLGDRRANAAKKYLGTIGVPADKLETVSKGSLEAAKQGDEAAMMKDRRVELVILKK
jgi:peptidoglycan-associated lipoprotein